LELWIKVLEIQLIILTDGWMISHLESGTVANSTNDEPEIQNNGGNVKGAIVPLDARINLG
jgi:hypothetical protein